MARARAINEVKNDGHDTYLRLRPVRRSFLAQPPDLKRIHALAEQLSTSKALAQIKKRDPLLRYIELYMIRCLQVKNL